jgi:hypothetical protein
MTVAIQFAKFCLSAVQMNRGAAGNPANALATEFFRMTRGLKVKKA